MLGDLGAMFPASAEWKNASSLSILQHIAMALKDARHRVVNVDATVIAQSPRMSPHVADMRTNIARALQMPEAAVSIKATSTDGMGYTGRGEGIAAMAVALVERLV